MGAHVAAEAVARAGAEAAAIVRKDIELGARGVKLFLGTWLRGGNRAGTSSPRWASIPRGFVSLGRSEIPSSTGCVRQHLDVTTLE